MRPTVFHVGGTLYWVIQTRNPDTMVLKDADSTPTVAVRKNGASVGDSVTITKRSATTGIYDCSYNPAAEVEGDSFTLEESATVTGTTTAQATYTATWNARVVAVERGTDSANTTTPPTAAANASAVRTELATELARVDASISTRSTFAGGAVSSVTGNVGGNVVGSVGSVVGAVVLDSAITDQLDVIEETVLSSRYNLATPLSRSPNDAGVITFAWPVSGATITGTVSIDNASYVAIAGAITFLRTDAGKHYYTLAYNEDDRPAAEGSARYTLTDGTYTRYLVLRVVESGDTGEAAALAVLCLDWETITGEVPSRSTLNALRHIRNKWILDGTTKTVYAEDDTTPAYTTSVTADGGGNITGDTPD